MTNRMKADMFLLDSVKKKKKLSSARKRNKYQRHKCQLRNTIKWAIGEVNKVSSAPVQPELCFGSFFETMILLSYPKFVSPIHVPRCRFSISDHLFEYSQIIY